MSIFYAIGFLLNRQAKKKSEQSSVLDQLESNQTDFLSSLSSTASQSTSLNIQLWQRVTDLEDQQDDNQQQVELLKLSNQEKDQRIADLETQIRECLKLTSQ